MKSERQPLLVRTKRPITLFADTIQVDEYSPEDRYINSHTLNSSLLSCEDTQNEHGIRWRYDDYTTIDWIHDTVKERKRLRRVQSLVGVRGTILKYWDASQAWIILLIVGVISGLIASLMDILIPKLEYFKNCFHNDVCLALFNIRGLKDYDFGLNLIFGLLYALLSTYLVHLSPHHEIVSRSTNDDLNIYIDHIERHTHTPAIAESAHRQTDDTNQSSSNNRRRSSYRNTQLLEIKRKRTRFHAAGSGIPEVKTILGGFVIRGCLGIKTLLLKVLALTFSVAAGLMVGVQGPLVHIACSVGNVVSRNFKKYANNEAKRREILSASCAAGVSVAFGAPIGGVLFSLEELSLYFPPKTMWRAFFCALTAAVTLHLIDPFGTGKLVRFQVSYNSNWQLFELAPFLFLGAFGGLFGALFIKATRWIDRLKLDLRRTHNFAVIEVSVITIVTVTLSYVSEYTKMSNSVFVAELFSECKATGSDAGSALCNFNDPKSIILELCWVFCVKAFLILITFGIRVPGGIFLPSMVVGACFGRIVGSTMQYLTEGGVNKNLNIIPGVYAMVGAAGCLSGVTRMTVSLTVIMFELTGGLTYVLPIMSSIMMAKWVADSISRDSIYDSEIKAKGYPYLNHKHTILSKPALASYLMETVETLSTDSIYRILDIKAKFTAQENLHPSYDSGFVLLKNASILVGFISQNDLKHAMHVQETESFITSIVFHNAYSSLDGVDEMQSSQGSIFQATDNGVCDLSQWVDKAPLCISASASCEMVVEIFAKLGAKCLIVTRDGMYAGVIHKKRVLEFISAE